MGSEQKKKADENGKLIFAESYGGASESTKSRLNSASKEHGLPLLFHLLIASALLLTNEIH